MSYSFRTTYRQDEDTYVEDRGYAHVVKRGEEGFSDLEFEFGKILAIGQTARRDSEGTGWEVVDGFPLLELAKQSKMAEINAGFDAMTAAITATYPEKEVLTFDQQVAEAQAYQADSKAVCPMLQALSAARGLALDELCRRVLAKHQAFSFATGTLMGQRQAMEDMLDACTNVDDVASIVVDFHLPEVA